MASLFRARRHEEGRSGGKILRDRRAQPPASPYSRPENSTSPAAATQSGRPRGLFGLISGAGKLISSVLPSFGDSSPSSSADSSSNQDDLGSDFGGEDEDDVPFREFHKLSQREKKSELVENCMDGSLAIIPKSESKLVIEHLLMQETFSREESDKLIKLIQARVVDLPSAEVFKDGIQGLPYIRTSGNDIASPGASQFLSQSRKLQETISYSACKLNEFSPMSFAYEACSPSTCNKAVLEAKKWIEGKRLASSSKYDPECGPCTLNTDMLQTDFESEVGSPVDMAKSYMQSLPPWRSPSLSRIGVKTPPSGGMHLYKDRTSCAAVDHSLPSSKALKRDHLAIGSWDSIDETRRVRLKLSSKSIQFESSVRLSEDGTSQISSETCTKDGDPGVFNEKAIEVHQTLEAGMVNTSNLMSEPEGTIDAIKSDQGSPVPNCHLPEPSQSERGSELNPANIDMPILDNNQDVEVPAQIEEQVGSTPVHHDCVVLASMVVEHDGIPLSEAKILPSENIKSAAQDGADGVADHNDAHTSNIQTSCTVIGTLQANNSSQFNVVSGLEETNSDSRPQDRSSEISNDANGSVCKLPTNGSLTEVHTNSDHETLSKETNHAADKTPLNGTRMKSIERMLTEPQPSTGRRRRKVVVKSRRANRG